MRKKFLGAFLLGALTLAATSTFVSCKDYDGDISALKSDVSSLQNGLNDLKSQLTSQVSQLETKITDLKTKHDQDVIAIQNEFRGKDTELNNAITALNDQFTKHVSDYTTELSGVKTRLTTCEDAIKALQSDKADKSDVQAKYDALVGLIGDATTAANDSIERAKQACLAALDLQKKACEKATEDLTVLINNNGERIDSLAGVTTDNATAIGLNADKIQDNINEIKAIKARLADAEKEIGEHHNDIESLRSTMNELSEAINAANSRINILEVLVNKRLTSMVFAPTTYIHGIEAIAFYSLEYKAWSNLYADAADAKDPTTISNNGKTKVNYYLNPTSTKLEDIEGFSFIDQKASNTRAGEPLVEVIGEPTLEAGKLTLTLKKGRAAKITVVEEQNKETFDIVALKATLKDKANGANLAVYSDWARITEQTVGARIHDKRVQKNNKPVCDEDVVDAPHFYRFSEIYNAPAEVTNQPLHYKYAYDSEHIALEIPYNEADTLAKYVMVCDNNGNKIEESEYGLAYEFNLVEYNVLNENQTIDATNQSNYANISNNTLGIIKAQVKKGDETGVQNNRDAIGKTPVVQVKLIDTKNNQVVDVVYFRVLIGDVTVPPTVEERATYETSARFVCGELYTVTVGEDFLNSKLYAVEGENGMTQEEFHNVFVADSYAYSTKENAINGDARDRGFATVIDKASNEQSTQAHNLIVSFQNSVELTQALYDGTDKELVAYVRYTSKDGKAIRILPVKLTIAYKGDKVAQDVNYNKTYWSDVEPANADKYVTTNATLTTNSKYGKANDYFDAQMVNNLLNNYIKDGAAPSNVAALLKNSENTKIIFDKERLAVLPTGAANWQVNAAGDTLSYKEGADWVAAAVILTEGNMYNVHLVEKPAYGRHGQPTKGGLLLVNYDKADGTPTAEIQNAVPVKLVGEQCGLEITVDKYLVRFEQPLTFSKDDVEATVMDQITKTALNGGVVAGSVDTTPIDGKFLIKEAFGQYRTVTGDSELMLWYIVEKAVYDTANAKTNVQKDGTVGAECNVKLSDLKNSDGEPLYQVAVINSNAGTVLMPNYRKYVQFQNLHGNALQEDIKITIPVTLNTKWKKGIQYNVVVTVKKNLSTGGAK